MADVVSLGPVDAMRVEVRHLALPTGLPSFVLPSGQRTPTDLAALLVRVTDVDGNVGQSLLWAQAPQQLAVLEACVGFAAGALCSAAPAPPAELVGVVAGAGAFFGQGGVLRFGMSGIEMAVVDLGLRRRGLSLSGWLGRRHDRVRVYETGMMLFRSPEELVEEALANVAAGRTAMKMIVGSPSVADDVARISAVRQVLPDDAVLMADALGRWDLATAHDAVRAFDGLGLRWIEDPIGHADLAGYRSLGQSSAVPIATGEHQYELDRFDDLVSAGVGYVVAELERVGGTAGWRALAGHIDGTGVALLPHLYPHISAQLVSTLAQPEVWVEHVPWFDELTGQPFDVREGAIDVDDAPGTGFTPDPDAVERLSVSPWVGVGATA